MSVENRTAVMETENPNLFDQPPSQPVNEGDSRVQGANVQQVMGAQIATASTSRMVNGTYGAVGNAGPLSMDGEVQAPEQPLGAQGTESGGPSGRAGDSGIGTLKAAAGRVIANVAAKVQGVLPPAAKASAANSFLPREDTGSAGTQGTAFQTAGSVNYGEQSGPETRGVSEGGLFSPQQARRLQQMSNEAPLLYAEGARGAQAEEPTGGVLIPPLPHSSSSDSGQAEAIQAEVRKQMQVFMAAQSELQRRVALLSEENQLLRQVAVASDLNPEGIGPQEGRGGWFSGLRRNIMGFVQQVPGKASSMPYVTEGWQAFHGPPPGSSSYPCQQVPQQGVPIAAAPAASPQPLSLGYGLGPTPIASSVPASKASETGTAKGAPMPPPAQQWSGLQGSSSGLGPTEDSGPATAQVAAGCSIPGSSVYNPEVARAHPLDAVLSGMVQLQNVVADLATARTAGASSGGTSAAPEVVRPGVTELVKLPPPTLEGALGFADWLHAIKPSMSDLSDSSGECWQQVLRQAQEWYTGEYVPAGPVARVRLKAPASMVDKELKWNRVRHRMEHLILQSCPEGVRAELSSARVSGVLNIMCRLYTIYKPGGVTERAEALRQVQQPRSADSAIDAVMKLRTWRRWMTRLSDLGGTQPDAAVCIQALEGITAGVLKGLPSLSFRVNLVRASLHLDTQPSAAKVDEFYEHLLAELEGVSRVTEATAAASVIPGRSESTKVRQVEAKASNNSSVEGSTLSGKDKTPKAPTQQGADSPKKLRKWFAEGKGCRRGKDCRFLHDWAQIPKAEKGDRCMLCGGKGHRKDACTVVTNGAMAKRDDGASSAKAARSDASPKAKTGDPGLRKVISEAATVLREAMSTSATAGDSNSPPPNAGSSAQAGEGSEAPPMAVAAKIQAQLQDLEARVLDGGASIRAVREVPTVEPGEPTALLDSGATHVVLDDAAAGAQDLVPCTVSLAGDQRQTWHQTPGGSLVAPVTGDGHAPQTILPLGSLVSQLGCVLRWSQKAGLQLIHPKLGRLKTCLKGGCPQLSKDQALSLIHELESARLGELTGRLRRVQAHLKASGGMKFSDVLDAFVESGSYTSALALAQHTPFLESVPSRIISQMVVDLQGANGWELLKAVPLNRRIRKRLHQSYSWLLHLGAGVPDPVLKQVCREQQIEIVSISTAEGKVVEPGVWKALSWAAFTGRLSGIVSDAPMRTWSGVKVDASHTVHLRTPDHPWGVPSNSEGHQSKVNNDAVFSLQPMWLWTIASIAQGSGIPFLQTHVLPQHGSVQPWMDSVVRPFSVWSNCSQFRVAEVSEAGARNRPMVVCSNLGFGDRVVGMNNSGPGAANEVCVSGWTASFKREVTMALFGTSPQAQATMQVEVPQVSAVGTGVGRLHSDRRQGQEESRAEGEALSPLQEEAEDSSPSPPAAGVRGKAPQLPHEDTRPASKPISEKDRERWRRHIAAHHIPFRKDCLKCVMAGALGLQHRRVKCPSMYALAFDLAGPFKERGKDDKGGGYKYVLVAGLRVPDIALPGGDVQEPTARGPAPASVEVGNTQTVRDDDEGSEVSWLNANLEPTAGVKHVSQHDEDSDHEQGSVGSWFEMPDIDDLPEPEEDGEPAQAEAEYEGLPDEGKATVLEGDLWEDALGVSGMSDEQFDTELSQMLFDGANKVLRFAVPVRSRKGPQILAALQEVVTECNRLGFPVKVAHTDRAKELMSKATTEWLQSKLIQPSFTQGDDPQANGLAERLVGWVKARARLHLAASGLGVEQWPAAMSFACTEHRHRMLQVEASLPRFGQKVIFKSKHPTGHSKRPFLRWEHAVYLCPTARTEGGHVLLRATSGAYLVAKNVRCVENLVDPEAELGDEAVLEADFPDDLPRASSSDPLPMPSRRVTGKRAVKAISLPSEVLAEDLRRNELFTPDHCGRLLELAFGGADTVSKRTHRGPMELAVVLGAYGHGGLHGVTRASRVYPEVCKYLNEYLRRNLPPGQVNPKWSAVTVVVAPEVAVHKDVRNEPGSVNFVTQVTTRSMWIEGATQEGCKQACVDAKGKEYQGCHLPLTQVTTTFDPKLRHSVLPATNWVIAGYTPLGSSKLPPARLRELEELGFRTPEPSLPTVCKLVGPCSNRLPDPRSRRHPPPPPRRAGLSVRYARMSGQEWAELCELDEEQFEARISRWQRVLGGADEDPTLDPVSASIPHHLLIATVFQNRDWRRDPEVIANGSDGPVLAARVLDFSDDGPPDESPFPDRMLMFSVHDLVRDVFEMVILRVVLIEEEQGGQRDPMQPVLQMPGPPPPEVRAISTTASLPRRDEVRPDRLPVSLPNPTCIQVNPAMSRKEMSPQEEALLCKTEAATTKGLEDILSSLTEPLSVTHTASQEEVRANLEKWRPAIEKELKSLKEPGVLVSHFGKEARALIAGAGTTVIPLKGVFTTKAPGGPQDGLYRRKCRLVGCGNQASHIDADSLYAAGAPAELVRASLVQACRHQWSAFTCDIRSAFTQTPIPPYAARRYMLRPPRWLVELGLAEPDEYYSLGKVLYGFKEAPAWWSEHRDSKLLTAAFLGCHLEQGTSDPSLWRIMKGEELKGYLVTYVDDFLILSDSVTAGGLHQWLLEEAGWETDGLSEAKPGEPVRFLGMQLERHEDGHFSLNQESYIDELIRAYQLKSGDKSRIACPKEVLMNEPESVPESDEATVKAAQKVAGECLWLSQRTRFDISFSTAILCSRVSKDPSGALAIGKRLLCYLHQTKGFKLHLRPDPSAAPLRVFTDASFAPQGQHSFGGHIIELYGVPAVWRASRQGLIALSSAEAELIQAVEGCMFAESLLTVLEDLRVQCSTAQLLLDNTAAMAFIGGSGSQRTRHLKVRGHKIRQLIQSGWEIKHCPGEFQRADLLTKPLSAARMRFLRELLQLGDDEAPEPAQEREDIPAARAMQAAPASCVSALLMLLQVCACKGDEVENEDGAAAMPIDWPWELAVLTLLIVLSTLFVWEASGAPCRRRQVPVPEIRAVTVKERRAKKLQDRVAAAIDSAVSESPTGDEGHAARRKGRNKCPPVPTDGAAAARDTPTVVYGGINMHVGNHGSPSELQDQVAQSSATSAPASSTFYPGKVSPPPVPTDPAEPTRVSQGSFPRGPNPHAFRTRTQATQTDSVVVLGSEDHVYVSGGGECVHVCRNCRGLRNAGSVKHKTLCQYCLRNQKVDGA